MRQFFNVTKCNSYLKGMRKEKRKIHNKVVFKPYTQNQMWLLPPSLGELIPSNHIVRLVSEAIDGMDMSEILKTYDGGGASNYHPKMLLKALIYGYIEKTYSSRQIEKALQENICFMWLCGMQQPDHNTINRFRKGQLKNTVKDVFAQVLLLLIDKDIVRIEDYHIDGTKIESVANRYTFVWAKSVAKYKASLLEKIALLVEQIEQVNEKETKKESTQANSTGNNENISPPESNSKSGKDKIEDSESLKKTIARINDQLKEELSKSKRLENKVNKLENDYLTKLSEYEKHEQILEGRSSYSKTDPDATFMRMKEDHMKNGQLKPGYNVQIGTSDQFIFNYTIHQNATDFPVFISHMEQTAQLFKTINQPLPKRLIGDAGYGSEQNYDYLQNKGIENYLKYPGYHQEKKSSFKKNGFHTKNLHYNSQEDYYVCPMGQHMTYQYTTKQKSKSGYESKNRVYKAQNCEGCPLRAVCHKAKTNRILYANPNLNKHRKIAKANLDSLRGIRLRKKRCCDVEPVFGHIKSNRLFKRFMLRSLEKVNIEFGLLAIAHNIKKWWVKIQKDLTKSSNPLPTNTNQSLSPNSHFLSLFVPFLGFKLLTTHSASLKFSKAFF